MSTLSVQAGHAVLDHRDSLSEALVAVEFERNPGLTAHYGPAARAKSLQDARFHLSYLAEALLFESSGLFVDYVAWAKVMLSHRRVLPEHLAAHLTVMAGVLRDAFPGALGEEAAAVVELAVRAMPNVRADLPSFHDESQLTWPIAQLYQQALLRGDRRAASRLVLEALDQGYSLSDIYLQVLQPTQYEVGRLWQVDRIGVGEEHFCTAATQLMMSQLYPHLVAAPRTGRTLVASCVSGDLHELGIRMLADFFEMAGWDTFYTGANTPHKAVLDAVVSRDADVLAISATIAFHLHEVSALIEAVRGDPRCANVKILVGGYPFNANPDLWRQVGADGSGADAQEAVSAATRLLRGQTMSNNTDSAP